MSDLALNADLLEAATAAIVDEFSRSARLRSLVARELAMPGGNYGVVVPRVVKAAAQAGQAAPIEANTDLLVKPITLTSEIRIKPQQVDDFELVLALVRAGVRRLNNTEDRIIAYGGALLPLSSPDLQIQGLVGSTAGLLFPGGALEATRMDPQADSLRRRLAAARARLEAQNSYLDPYACALAPRAWDEYVSATSTANFAALLGSTHILPVVGAKVKIDVALDAKAPDATKPLTAHGVLFSRELIACDLIRVMPPTGSSRGFDNMGALRYVIETQFLLRVKDDAGFARIWVDDDGQFYFIDPAPPSP